VPAPLIRQALHERGPGGGCCMESEEDVVGMDRGEGAAVEVRILLPDPGVPEERGIVDAVASKACERLGDADLKREGVCVGGGLLQVTASHGMEARLD
jgi:hypothetical protein